MNFGDYKATSIVVILRRLLLPPYEPDNDKKDEKGTFFLK